MKRILLFLVMISCVTWAAQHRTRTRAFLNTYISGDSFRAVCDVSVDCQTLSFDPKKIRYGDTVFVCADLLTFFFTQVHPYIQGSYILVTHNSDAQAPGQFACYLDDPKIIAWFGQNYDGIPHRKFFPIPTGIPNNYWPWVNTTCIDSESALAKTCNRSITLYFNFVHKNAEREKLKKMFEDTSFCIVSQRKLYSEYINDMAHSKFVLSPLGKGHDTNRTWEALLVGAIPVVRSSSLDTLFEGLPVLIVDDWTTITEEFLSTAYEQMKQNTYHNERMFAPYWLNKIAAVKKAAEELFIAVRTTRRASGE